MISSEQREHLDSLINHHVETERMCVKASGTPEAEERNTVATRAWSELQEFLDNITEQ
jgi:hypothetical protein